MSPRSLPYVELYNLDNDGDLNNVYARPDVYNIGIESVPTLCKGQLFWREGRERGRIRHIKRNKSYRGNYYYTLSAGQGYYLSSVQMVIMYGGYLYSIEGNNIVVKLDRTILEEKRRSCRMCISDCNDKVCPFYDSILDYI